MGVEMMARAGYDPRQASLLWVQMQKVGGRSVPEFLSTHPSNSSRIDYLATAGREYFNLYQQNQSRRRCR